MKRNRLFIVLVLGVTAGALAGLLALSYLRNATARPLLGTEAPKGKLVVAATNLALGDVVGPEDVRLIDWPAGALPAGFAARPDEVVGRGLITPVAANEPLLKTKLSTLEEGGGLPIIIPEGMRGVSVKVDQVVGVAGFVLPNTKVDVLVTIKPPEEGGEEPLPTTKVILQNILVLTAGQIIQRDAEGKPQQVPVVTLLVTPEQGERLILAANEGRIQLALRNTLDLDSVTTLGIRTNAILGEVAPPPVRRVTRPVRVRPSGGSSAREPVGGAVVETFRGGQRTLQTFSPGRQ